MGDTEKQNVHFSGLFLDDEPIAFHLGFISNGRLLWYKPSIQSGLRRGSPGVALIKYLVCSAREYGLEELDFTIGEEAFKNRFCREKRLVDTFRVHKSRHRYYADIGYWRMRRTLKRVFD